MPRSNLLNYYALPLSTSVGERVIGVQLYGRGLNNLPQSALLEAGTAMEQAAFQKWPNGVPSSLLIYYRLISPSRKSFQTRTEKFLSTGTLGQTTCSL